MGIGTILEARKILLLATGPSKAAPVAKSIEGPVTAAVSASALQLHPDVTFIIDDAAAAQLTQRDYYHRVLEMTALLTPDQALLSPDSLLHGLTARTITGQIYPGCGGSLYPSADWLKHETCKTLSDVPQAFRKALSRRRRGTYR